jgi:hypothetical protein
MELDFQLEELDEAEQMLVQVSFIIKSKEA